MKRRIRLAGAVGVWVAACLLAGVLWAAGQERPLPGTQLIPGPFGDGQVMLFAEGAAGPVVAVSRAEGSLLACLETASQTVESLELPGPLLGAAYGPSGFFALQEKDSLLQVSAFSPGLEEAGSNIVFLPADSLAMAQCSPLGTVYCVAFDAPSLLQCFAWDGQEGGRDFGQPIEGLWFTPGGQLWVRAGGQAYVGEGEDLQCLGPVDCPSPPIGVVGEGVFCCEAGSLWQLHDGGAQLLMQGGFAPNLCWAGPQGVLWAQEATRVARLGLDGSAGGSCQVAGELLALTEASALYIGENGLYCAVHSLFSQEPPVSSQPGESQPEGPLPSWIPVYQEGYMVVPPGALAEELRRLLYPQELDIFTVEGEPVQSGPLATGMRAGEWQVVALGDCDGDGRTTRRDVEMAQAMLLEGSPEELPLLAADMDGDGSLTTADLVRMAACVGYSKRT